MKILLHVSLCLAVSITAVLATPRHRSSVNRGFPFYVKEKLGNVCLEIRKVKQEVDRCCNQKGQYISVDKTQGFVVSVKQISWLAMSHSQSGQQHKQTNKLKVYEYKCDKCEAS